MTQMETTLRIGKSGITPNILTQVKTHLRRKKIIKVKFLPTAVTQKKKQVDDLAAAVHAKVIHRVGFIAILQRKD